MKSNILSIDAESDGLYGPVWAIGAIVINSKGKEISRFEGQISSDIVTDSWVIKNIVPYVNLPKYNTALGLRDAFWKFWIENKKDAIVIADFGAIVEGGLFRACVADDPNRTWDGPYPMHELGTALLLAGIDPDIDRKEYSGLKDLDKHNPVHDAILAAACWKKSTANVVNMTTLTELFYKLK